MSRPCTYSFFSFIAFCDDRISFHISQTLTLYLRSIPYFPSCVLLSIISPLYFLCLLPSSAHNPAARAGCLCMSAFGACTTHLSLLDFRGRKQSYAEQHASFLHFLRHYDKPDWLYGETVSSVWVSEFQEVLFL